VTTVLYPHGRNPAENPPNESVKRRPTSFRLLPKPQPCGNGGQSSRFRSEMRVPLASKPSQSRCVQTPKFGGLTNISFCGTS